MTHRAVRLPAAALPFARLVLSEPEFEPLCSEQTGIYSDEDEGETLWYYVQRGESDIEIVTDDDDDDSGDDESENDSDADDDDSGDDEPENNSGDDDDGADMIPEYDSTDSSATLGSTDTWSTVDWLNMTTEEEDSSDDSDIESENVVNMRELIFAMSFI